MTSEMDIHPDNPTYGRQESAPPTYEQVQKDAPPSYQALYGEIKGAKAGSSGMVDFLAKLVLILIKTVFGTIILGIIMAIPIAMIVIGLTYKQDCPGQIYIPIYLIVGGVFMALKIGIHLWTKFTNRRIREDEVTQMGKQGLISHLIGCFLFGWFIAGNVWLYSLDVDTHDVGSTYYCRGIVYYFAFWLTNSVYIIIGLFSACICCTAYAVADVSVSRSVNADAV